MKSLFKKIVIFLLTLEARLVLSKYQPKIIAITGSVGKTTSKDAIYDVLKNDFSIRKNQKSFNSETGVPLTILDLPNQWRSVPGWLSNLWKGLRQVLGSKEYPEWLVLEVGTGEPGDIKAITKWLKPDIVVLTRFPDLPVHVEHFESPEQVIEEKMHLARALKEDGVLVVNYDDPKTRAAHALDTALTLSYGLELGADMIASDVRVHYNQDGNPDGMWYRADWKDQSSQVILEGVLGEQHVYTTLPALTIGAHLGLKLSDMAAMLTHRELTPGRMRILPGINDTVIIDDSYNSSPEAVEKALEIFKQIKTSGRRIVVFGDMNELGDYAPEQHKKAGILLAEVADHLFTVGHLSVIAAESAKESGMHEGRVMTCNDARQAGMTLQQFLKPGDVVLVKGSEAGVRTERTVEMIMAEPQRAGELLVRQEEEWREKE